MIKVNSNNKAKLKRNVKNNISSKNKSYARKIEKYVLFKKKKFLENNNFIELVKNLSLMSSIG